MQLFSTPWTAACQASPSSTISWSLFKFMSTDLVMLSDHLILYILDTFTSNFIINLWANSYYNSIIFYRSENKDTEKWVTPFTKYSQTEAPSPPFFFLEFKFWNLYSLVQNLKLSEADNGVGIFPGKWFLFSPPPIYILSSTTNSMWIYMCSCKQERERLQEREIGIFFNNEKQKAGIAICKIIFVPFSPHSGERKLLVS